MKAKQKKARVASKKTAKKADLMIRFQSARRYWESSDFKRAADSFREIFKLDHRDPYFSRYWLASSLFQLGSFDELDKLLRQHDDPSGIWRFAQALAAFRLHGDTDETQRLLVEADHLEPGFEDYLLGGKVVDAGREVRFDSGDVERAFGCARLFLPAWRGVPGAATWARRVLKVPLAGTDAADLPRRFPRDELRALPLRRETWQVGLMRKPDESRDNPQGEKSPLWMLGVANVDGQEIRVITVIDRTLTETVVWNEMIQSFLSPNDGDPARPSTLVVCRRDFYDAWQPLLSEIGIRCRYENDPQPVGELLGAMCRELDKRALPPVENVKVREFPQSECCLADRLLPLAGMGCERTRSAVPAVVDARAEQVAFGCSGDFPCAGDPTPEMLLEFLVRTMARPAGGSAQRPRAVEVSDSNCYDYLRPRLEAAGVACRLVDEMSEFNDFCLRLARSFDGSEKCAIADGKGVTRAQMESFFEAAEYYFQSAPWSGVPGEVPIEICCDDPRMGTRYAIVLGRTGVQLGLCIYDDWATTRRGTQRAFLARRESFAGGLLRRSADHGGGRSAIDRTPGLADRDAGSVAGGNADRTAPYAAFTHRGGIGVSGCLPARHPRFHRGEIALANPASGNGHPFG